MSEIRDKVVYLHKDLNGVVRYVGHGTLDRATKFSNCNRSKAWIEVFQDYRPAVEIVARDLSYREALKLEQETIIKYSDTVVNINLPTTAHELSFDYLNEWFYIDPGCPSGLRWKKQQHRSKKYAGDQAGSILTKETGKKYWQIKLNRKVYKVHRIVYVLHTGAIEQDLVIDHIDGNSLNNKVENLRLVTHFVNCLNKSVSRNKELPQKWVKETDNMFYAAFEIRGKVYNFRTKKEDHESRDVALKFITNLVEETRNNLISEIDLNDKTKIEVNLEHT